MDNEELEKKLKWYEKKYGPYINKRGLQNYKNLFRKPILYEWIILAILILSLFMSFAYDVDINNCRTYYEENIVEIYKLRMNTEEVTDNVIITEEDLRSVEFKGG